MSSKCKVALSTDRRWEYSWRKYTAYTLIDKILKGRWIPRFIYPWKKLKEKSKSGNRGSISKT